MERPLLGFLLRLDELELHCGSESGIRATTCSSRTSPVGPARATTTTVWPSSA
jgi:hypothetical protein